MTGPGAMLAGKIGAKLYTIPEGYAVEHDCQTVTFPEFGQFVDYAKKYATTQRIQAYKALGLHSKGTENCRNEIEMAADRVADKLSATKERQRRKSERSEKTRPLKQLAVWYLLCLVAVMAWIYFLGGPHGARSCDGGECYPPPRFWWDAFEAAGIAWFATTFVYLLLARAEKRTTNTG